MLAKGKNQEAAISPTLRVSLSGVSEEAALAEERALIQLSPRICCLCSRIN